MDNLCHLTLTPISKDSKSPSYIDYNEQLSRVLHDGFHWCWDDSRYNKSNIGGYFAYYFHGIRVVIHRIMDIKPPAGQGHRNVVELSHPLLEISWIEWQLMNGPESKMGTYTTTDLSYSSPQLYQYLMSVLETNVKLIIEDDDEIEKEEKSLLLRLEKIQNIKKTNQLKNEKNDLLEQIKTLTNLVNNIDTQIEEITNF
jgi:hypothetical protein